MASNASLFYEGKYDSLLSIYSKLETKTSQDLLNCAIAGFLSDGRSPMPELEKAEKMMFSEATKKDDWPLHRSWAVLQYNKALFLLATGDYTAAGKVLDFLWANRRFIANTTLVFVALLMLELAVRVQNPKRAQEASEFLKDIPKDGSFTESLSIPNKEVVRRVAEMIQLSKLRSNVVVETANNNEIAHAFFREVVTTWERSNSDSKNPQKTLSLPQLLPFACAALYLQDHSKMETLLRLAPDQNHCVVLNNRGVLDIIQKRYSSALLLFSKALGTRSKDEIVYPYHRVLYNIGFCLLSKEKPKKAFRYFYSIVPFLSDFPYLWMRLAECCAMYFKKRVAKLRRRYQLTGVIARRLSTASKTYTILPMSDSRLFARYRKTDGISSKLTLEFGEKCARNAMRLCSESQANLKQSAMLLCQYISLELGDWKRAQMLSKSPPGATPDAATRILSMCYTSQAFYMMKDFTNADSTLKKHIFDQIGFCNSNPEYATMIYQTTSRVAEAKKEKDKYIKSLNKCPSEEKNCREVVLLQVAFELQNKRVEKALTCLEEYQDPE